MTAWDKLLEFSSLAYGDAWQLMNNPRIDAGFILNDGHIVDVEDPPTVSIDDQQIEAIIVDSRTVIMLPT